jgi:ABC-type lipoprotein release transport system permease subunit
VVELPVTRVHHASRGRLDDERRLDDLGAIVRSIATRSVVRLDTVSARYERLTAETRLAAVVTTGFGVIGLLVAMSGIYAVMAFLVASRSREIAIRMALGADPAGILRLTLGSSARFVAIGTAVGLSSAVLAAKWLSAQLFEVQPTDPATYAFVALAVVGTALAATWRPARQASRIDPASTLTTQ